MYFIVPGVRIPHCLPETQLNPQIKAFKQHYNKKNSVKNVKCPTKCPTLTSTSTKYLYKRGKTYYFSKKINGKAVKISLKSSNLNYCIMLKNKILYELNMQKQSKEEKELIAKLLQKTTLTKNEAEILYGKSELKNIDKQYNEDNTNTLNKEEKEAYINELFKDEIETEKELIELKNNDTNTILKKIDAIQNINTTTISNEETHNIYNNLDVYFNNYLEHKKTYNKISNSSIKAYNASFKYLKYFTNKNTVFNFAFFKQVQQQMQQLPKNFFTHKNYKNTSYKEILKLKKIEKLNTKTINNHINNMSSFFDFLEYEEIITSNPLLKIKPLLESQEIVKLEYLKDELDTIFNNKNIEKEYLNMCSLLFIQA